VLVRFVSVVRWDAVLEGVQEDRRIWVGSTTWQGRKAIRVSVSNWQTGDEEIDLAVAAFSDAYAGKSPAL
jgi:hypothetical protein